MRRFGYVDVYPCLNFALNGYTPHEWHGVLRIVVELVELGLDDGTTILHLSIPLLGSRRSNRGKYGRLLRGTLARSLRFLRGRGLVLSVVVEFLGATIRSGRAVSVGGRPLLGRRLAFGRLGRGVSGAARRGGREFLASAGARGD